MAAVLACGPGAVISHASAAALQDLRPSAAIRIDVTVPGRRGRSRAGIRVHSGDALHRDERDVYEGIPSTSAARTLLDLAGVLDHRGLERACERAAQLGVLDVHAVNRLRVRHAGRRGVARLNAVLEEWDPELVRTRSELEALFMRMVSRAGLERPLVNHRLEVGGETFEVDFHWPHSRLVVETDGGRFHDNPLARRRDTVRDRLLRDAGWAVERFGWWDVTGMASRTLLVISRHVSHVDLTRTSG